MVIFSTILIELFLFSLGAAYQSMKTGPSKAQAADVNLEDRDSWQCLQNRLLVPLAQQLLTHIVRLLGICHHVIEGKEPGPPKNPVVVRCFALAVL